MSLQREEGLLRADGAAHPLRRVLRFLAIWGPGLLVMIADTDPGNVVAAAQSGAAWGYRFLPLTLLLIVPLYFVQELTVRLGIFSGRGFGAMVRDNFGRFWTICATATLVIAAVGSLVTEFTGVAGVGEIYDIPRFVSLGAAAAVVIAIAMTGSYRRIERIALLIGAFEVAFFVIAWQAGPSLAQMSRDAIDQPILRPDFGFLAAAIIGASFNPWMVFYQQSAVVERKLKAKDLRAARWDTGAGAVLTQCLTAAVLIASAATLGRTNPGQELTSVRQIADAFASVSPDISRLVFSMGVLGAALVAVIVASMAVTWGIGEILGFDHTGRSGMPTWFRGGYVVAVAGSAVFVGLVSNLIWLNIAVQVANAILLPVMLVLLITLACRALPAERRPKGVELFAIIACSGAAALAGVFGVIGAFRG